MELELNSFLATSIRVIGFYALINGCFRIMGKREVGELSLFDLIVLILIAEIAAIAIEAELDQMIYMAFAIILLASIQWILAYVSLKNNRLRTILDGTSSLIIDKGKLNIEQMKKNRYNVDDLLTQLHDHDIRSISEVEYAVLETSGEITPFKYSDTNRNIFPFPVIISGEIQKNNLKYSGKSVEWIRQKIKEKNYESEKEIYFASVENDDLYIAGAIE